MSNSYIVFKWYTDRTKTHEIFDTVDDLLAYVVQETKLGSKICVYKMGECIGDWS